MTELIKDSVKNGTVGYYYHNKKDTSEIVMYYSNFKVAKPTQAVIDSLNKLNREYSKFLFRAKAITDYQRVLEKNIAINRWLFKFFGLISLIAFVFSLSKWHKYRIDLDK
jgi:hypothetical protein